MAATQPAAARRAGQHARVIPRSLARRAIVKVAAAFRFWWARQQFSDSAGRTCAIEAGVVVCFVVIDRTASTLVDRWGRGAAGEELVGKVLDRLRERGWFALHDVQLGRGNIDHVLVGPAGVFTIETKSHCGRLRASAIEVRMLKQAYAQAKLIERITGLRADPLLSYSATPT